MKPNEAALAERTPAASLRDSGPLPPHARKRSAEATFDSRRFEAMRAFFDSDAALSIFPRRLYARPSHAAPSEDAPTSRIAPMSHPQAPPGVLRLGHSPDPDDAFMFYGLARDLVDSEGLEFEHLLEDIETLNRRATRGELEVTALSLNAYTQVADKYLILNSGASMGSGYGPMVVAREPFLPELTAKKTIAVPGENTTAFLTLRMCIGDFEYEVVPFDEIFAAVADGKADAGLIIHEGQLTFRDEGFFCILDLGKWWEKETGGLPLPLGINAVRRDLGPEMCRRIDRVLKRSIKFSLDNRPAAVDYALRWGRNLDTAKADKFIGMYVNELTMDTGGIGRPAIDRYLERAAALKLIPEGFRAEFVGD